MTLDIKRIKGTVPKEYLANVSRKIFNTAISLDIDVPKLTLVVLKKDYLEASADRIVVTRDSSNNISYTIEEI